MGYYRKKIQGVEGMEFPRVFKKWYVHVEYPEVINKKKLGFPRNVTQLCEAFFCPEFLRIK